jgi:virginiamycin B lyase
MTSDERMANMTKAINEAIKVMGNRFGSTEGDVARTIQMSMKYVFVLALLLFIALPAHAAGPEMYEFDLPAGAHPHDVAPAPDGGVWYTAQHQAALGHLDPKSGKIRQIPLGKGSSPHGVIVGPDGAPWVTDSGLNAIVRVDPTTDAVKLFPLPIEESVNLNTAAFDQRGTLWFTGQSGYYGRVNPESGVVEVYKAPRGRGPYGIATTPGGDVWYASLAGSHIARIDPVSGRATIVEPPTTGQGARRVWADSIGQVWVSEWNAGQLSVYNAKMKQWHSWKLPGQKPQAYAVYVDHNDKVWLSDFGGDMILRFDPVTEFFTPFTLPTAGAKVRQILGRPGEIWLPESATDKLAVICDPCRFRKAATSPE